MANESRKQKMYDTLRGQITTRLVRTTDIIDGDIARLSLAELINTLFLMHGDSGSIGNFSVSFGAASKLIGPDLMWQEPAVVTEPTGLVQ